MSETPDGAMPTRIVLPRDSVIPGGVVPEHSPRHSRRTGEGPWGTPYVSPLVHLRDERDRRAWFHFCHGHHMEFLYWEATVVACHRLATAAAALDSAGVMLWGDRLDALIRGSGAMLSFCGAFDPEVYDPLLRASMAEQRDDFSGDMSRDFLAMMRAKQELVQALTTSGDGHPAQRRLLTDAERYWYRHHGEVVMALHPGDSLLKVKIDALSAEDRDFDYHRYISTVVRGEEALADYDSYFGVERSDTMTLADYWTQAVSKVDTVHRHFDLLPHERALLLRSDAVLLAVISEQLAEEVVRPE